MGNKQGYPRLSQVIPADSQVIPDMTVFRVGDGTVPLAIVIYIDCSFVKHSIPVKPIYITAYSDFVEIYPML